MQEQSTSKLPLFGFNFDNVSLRQAAQRVLDLADGSELGHYVVTPNLDHAVIRNKRAELATVYDSAALVIADGSPLIWASQWLGKPLQERVAGSDLLPAVFHAAHRPLRVYLLGARPGVAARAAQRVEGEYPNIRIVGVQSPPIGFEKRTESNDEAARQVADCAPDILVLGLGAPKQELWAHRERHRLNAKVIICAGATIDFLAGERKRAPVWCQRYGLEWAYRALEEPVRLVPRYTEDALMFPLFFARELLKRDGQPHRGER